MAEVDAAEVPAVENFILGALEPKLLHSFLRSAVRKYIGASAPEELFKQAAQLGVLPKHSNVRIVPPWPSPPALSSPVGTGIRQRLKIMTIRPKRL